MGFHDEVHGVPALLSVRYIGDLGLGIDERPVRYISNHPYYFSVKIFVPPSSYAPPYGSFIWKELFCKALTQNDDRLIGLVIAVTEQVSCYAADAERFKIAGYYDIPSSRDCCF